MDIRDNKIGAAVITVIFIAIIYYFSFTFGQIKGGLDEINVLKQFNVYTGVASLALIGIFAIIILEFLIKKGDDEYGNGIGYYNLGELPHLKFFNNYSGFQLSWLALIIFLFLAMLNVLLATQNPLLQESYTGIGLLEQQQFTPGESALFATLLIPASETLAIVFVIALTIVIIRAFARKYGIGEFNFTILVIFSVVIVCFITGLLWHIRVYPENDKIRIIGSMFWAVKGLLITLIGLAVIGWLLHLVNNGSFNLVTLFNSDTITTLFFILILVLVGGYIWIYRGKSLTGVNS